MQKRLLKQISEIRMGDPRDFTNFMCAVIDRAAYDTITGYIRHAKRSKDAKILCGGNFSSKKGYFIEPTVVLAKKPDMKLLCEEIFGPVLTIYVYKDARLERALDICDTGSPYALTGGIFARDRAAIVHMTEDDIFNSIEEHAKDGVDFMTLHCGVTQRIVKRIAKHPRLAGIVSRGGTFLAAWILHHDKENPLYANYDYLLELTQKYDFALSLGDGLRPGCIFDSTDWPQIQELLMIPEMGQDYDINITDARPDTGGLSGAPPSEAASWGKIDPSKIEETVTAYLDVTLAFPLLTAYTIQTTKPKKLKRLYDRGDELRKKLIESYLENNKEVEKLKGLIKKLSS